MTKKRDFSLPPVRIEPRLFKDAEKVARLAGARIRSEVEQYLAAGAASRHRPWGWTVDRILRDLLAGKDVSRLFSERPGKRDRGIPLKAAIATEHARLVLALLDQGATEMTAARLATAAIVRELRNERKRNPKEREVLTKQVQRAVKDWVPRYREDDGSVLIDPRRVVERYQAELDALDANKKAPGRE